MKRITIYLQILVCVFAFAKANSSQAQQDFKGVANYISQTKLNFKKDSLADVKAASNPMMAELMAQLKKGSTDEFELVFNKTESSFQKVQQLATPAPKNEGLSIKVNSPSSAHLYKNLEKGTYVKQGNIMDKEFVIQDKLENPTWELKNESKQIGKYTCFKAVYLPKEKELTEAEKKEKEAEKEAQKGKEVGLFAAIQSTSKEIVAWYTPEIPVSNGPGAYHGLPGLIMELTEGNTVTLCTSIEINSASVPKISIPKAGKKVSQAEYDKIQEEKMDEMKAKNGGSGVIFRSIGN